MKERTKKKTFISGPVQPAFIADAIAKHSSKTHIGAHMIFLGQVRADEKAHGTVKAIEYTAYEEMAEEKFHEIREAAFEKFELSCMHVYHSLGEVKAGEICLFVFVSSPRRKVAAEACTWLVEEIKAGVPVWGREILGEEKHVWKTNTP